jgi:DNA-binding transcriptional LysR family regulator
MELRLLEYFVAVAELEHVGKAAQRLHISQSPLSRQIRRLEKELELQLFVRRRQRIYLTESGRWLLRRAQGLLGQFESIRKESEQRARGETGTLAIAFTSAAIGNGILPRWLKKFQTGHPAARVSLQQMRSTLQVEAITAGRIDIGFVSTLPKDERMEGQCVAEEASLLVMPVGHPLAKRRSIRPEDLDGLRWIFLSETISLEKQNQFCAACAKAGFVPEVVQNVTEPTTLLAFVESGFGIGIIRSSARKYAPRTLVFREVPWMPFKNRTFLIRSGGELGPLAAAFAQYAPNHEPVLC